MTRADAARGVRIGVEECVFRVLPSFVSRRVARAVYYRSTTRARSRIPSACTEIYRRRREFEPAPRRNYFDASFESSSSSSVPAAAPGRVVVVHAGVSSEIRADLDASAAVSNVSPPAFGSARRRSAAARLGRDDSDNRPVFLGAPPRRNRAAPRRRRSRRRRTPLVAHGTLFAIRRSPPSGRLRCRFAGYQSTRRRLHARREPRRRCSHRRRAPAPPPRIFAVAVAAKAAVQAAVRRRRAECTVEARERREKRRLLEASSRSERGTIRQTVRQSTGVVAIARAPGTGRGARLEAVRVESFERREELRLLRGQRRRRAAGIGAHAIDETFAERRAASAAAAEELPRRAALGRLGESNPRN